MGKNSATRDATISIFKNLCSRLYGHQTGFVDACTLNKQMGMIVHARDLHIEFVAAFIRDQALLVHDKDTGCQGELEREMLASITPALSQNAEQGGCTSLMVLFIKNSFLELNVRNRRVRLIFVVQAAACSRRTDGQRQEIQKYIIIAINNISSSIAQQK